MRLNYLRVRQMKAHIKKVLGKLYFLKDTRLIQTVQRKFHIVLSCVLWAEESEGKERINKRRSSEQSLTPRNITAVDVLQVSIKRLLTLFLRLHINFQ